MKTNPHQTCLRLPDVLKEEMTTICDKYQINHSDLMRCAISEFVQTINANPQDNGKLMFVWYHPACKWYSYRSDILRILHPQKTLFLLVTGSFYVYRVNSEKDQGNMLGWWCKSAGSRVPRMPSEGFHRGIELGLFIPDILRQNSRTS